MNINHRLINSIIYYIGSFSTLLAIGVFLLFFKYQKKRSIWLIFLYCVYSLVNDTVLIILDGRNPTDFLFGLFTIAEMIFLLLYFRQVIRYRPLKRNIPYILGVFTIFSASWSIFLPIETAQQLPGLTELPLNVESLLLISISIFYFFEQITRPQSFFIYKTSDFWIVFGIMIYFAGNFFLFIFLQDLTSLEERARFFPLHSTLGATKYIMFAIAFLLQSNKEEFPSLLNKFKDSGDRVIN